MYAGMSGEKESAAPGQAPVADFRSDTVTRPSAGMRTAMAQAPVGDDVYGEDPTVRRLEETLAGMAGKEAALFFPTGTQSNLAALLVHCGRGDEYIAGDTYHIFKNEAGGAAVLGGIAPCPLPCDETGGLTPAQVTAAIKPDDAHYPISRLLCLENTVSGRVQTLSRIESLAQAARGKGLSIHLDGARIFNAAVALDQPLAKLCAPTDSVSICLSKGLGSPAGSVLCGAADFISRAQRARKILGGGMRQAGVLAACGLYALDRNLARLADDHARARRLAEGLAAIPGVEVDLPAVETNMVFADPGAGHHAPLQAYLADHGILIGAQEPNIRLVTHLDVDDAAIDLLVARTQDYCAHASASPAPAPRHG